MAGYKNFEMSNNAIRAYESGEKPKSKWTKEAILAEISSYGIEGDKLNACANLKSGQLKKLLVCTGWHHTSSHYNRTNFYAVDCAKIDEMSIDEIRSIPEPVKKAKNETIEKRKCRFLTWSGTRKHPKAEEHEEICEIKGNWAFTSCGKKSILGNGFQFVDQGDNGRGYANKY